MNTSKIYFPNLNGLRFIAALLVIIHHLEQLLSAFGLKNYWDNPVIESIGGLGVELFFVLSGFLISYLLFTEEQRTSTISIKDFYIRRVLRIWPLYYLIGFLAFFLLPNISMFNIPGWGDQLSANFDLSLLLYILFLPNLLLAGYGIVVPYASQSWSVGVEEQFYLIWPIIMKFFKHKLVALLLVIFGYLFFQFLGFRIIKHYITWSSELDLIRSFWGSFHIQCMAIGGIYAYLFYKKHRILKFILHPVTFIFITFLTIIMILFSLHVPYISRELFALLFGFIIVNLASDKQKGLFLENRLFNYLGKISYGLYMFHVIAIVISINIFQYYNMLHSHFLLLITSILITISISSVSYYLIEKRFISLKARYSKVISGDNAK